MQTLKSSKQTYSRKFLRDIFTLFASCAKFASVEAEKKIEAQNRAVIQFASKRKTKRPRREVDFLSI